MDKGIGKESTYADVPHDYRPEAPPVPPVINAPHNDKMAYIQAETMGAQRVIDGQERPRTQSAWENANKAREAAGLLPIKLVPRNGIDPSAYRGDLIAAGVLEPMPGAPEANPNAPDATLRAQGLAVLKSPESTKEQRTEAEMFLRAVGDGYKKGEGLDAFRLRMLAPGDPDKAQRWSHAEAIAAWAPEIQKRAALIDPRLSALVSLHLAHIQDGVRAVEVGAVREAVGKLDSDMERGKVSWSAQLDEESKLLRGASFRREEFARLNREQVADILTTARAPKSAQAAAESLAGRSRTATSTARASRASCRAAMTCHCLRGILSTSPAPCRSWRQRASWAHRRHR
jgi:hypothetical protein